MILRDAIAKAIKFTWKGKQRSPSKCVRFLPSVNSTRDMIYATNGPQGILIWVDERVPNVMIDADKLNAVVKGTKVVTMEAVANETVMLSGIKLEGGNVGEFPAIPPMPEAPLQKMPDWGVIEKVMHAVSVDPQQPLLKCLHFRKDLVEATDRFRVARAFVNTPWEGLVPSATFKHWPKGDVYASFSEDLAAFQVADEVRFTILKRGTYEDCDPVLPAWHDGSRVSVDTKALLQSIKRLKPLADVSQVTITANDVQVSGGGFNDRILTAHAVVYGAESTTLTVNVAWLCEALQNVETSKVMLGFTKQGDPLRVESGSFVVGLWPFGG